MIALDPTLATLAALPRGHRLLGLDVGTKTIGLAMSDVERSLATPLETIARGKFSADAERIRSLVERYSIGGLVAGLPVNMDGTEGPRAQATRAFMRNLCRLVPLPHAFWDERLSTAAVQRSLIAADASRAKRAEVVDRMAAAYILQGALDRIRVSREDSTTEDRY
ncbi:MAG: Holliday junction resolvase RuvX [Enterovirga sp.]|jgi:putative Holliday junction resolvase|nr:Holliday junction resolvase RuvX [Enterovirga sp.]